ncbi:MAG: DUF2007 domain-containing protein [Prolixibacteraceae bacterium]|nr:DUF2007 domain-containing protein [Prolixibacteraceae bacterium]MBN2773111.1 DUF2007 domain-containing protein [Prolixibacteraceae bacterium]
MVSNAPKLIEIYAGTMWEAGLLKSLLENAEIDVWLKDDIRGTSNFFLANSNSGVKVVISSDDYLKAKPVLEEFQKNQSEK